MEARIGSTITLNNTNYIVEELLSRTSTSRINISHTDARAHAKLRCHVLMHFECDDFQPGDIVTEHLEHIRLIATNGEGNFIISKQHTFKKEQSYVSTNPRRTEDL